MKALAIIMMVLSGINVLLFPLIIGKPRPNFSYVNFIAFVTEFVLISILGLRVLGII